MAVGAFTDKERPPTQAAVDAALGTSTGLWRETVTLLEERFRAKPELRFYGRNYGWAVRYRRHGKALASLYPAEGRFTVQVVLPPVAEATVGPRLRPATRALLANATAYKEGRWIFLPVVESDDLAELELLLGAKLAAVAGR